jgi:hypothetical protein
MDHFSNYEEEVMKKSYVMSIAMLMMLLSIMFFATGCAKQSTLAGTDWYDAVPKVEHEHRFPQGHKQKPSVKNEKTVAHEKCVYNEKTEIYFCQYHWIK